LVTVGLVKQLTLEAAKRAALGAGAKVVGAFAHRLPREHIARIVELSPDILLLAGGTDGGNEEVILQNARALAESPLNCPIVICGNRSVADEAQGALTARKKSAVVTENVMPEYGQLNIEPARSAIRQIFVERITKAKGLERDCSDFDKILSPTPAAVLRGAELISKGTASRRGLGDILVVDVGGATTDVYSICSGAPRAGIVPLGLPEPFSKRTVEGDLGVRHNAITIVEAIGMAEVAEKANVSLSFLESFLTTIREHPDHLPNSSQETAVDCALAWFAISHAVVRHAGNIETIYTNQGPITRQEGKDLSAVKVVIGTGGPIVHSLQPEIILEAALADPLTPNSLRPTSARFFVDKHYLLYAVGLLADIEPDTALELGIQNLKHVSGATNVASA
jgi:uncharacterized protein (TIGR01319 family)